MERRDPEAEILDALERHFAASQKLPLTCDGKVNVTALTAALGLRPSDAQYFYKSVAIKETVNAVAQDQGVLPIGHRADQSKADASVAARIARVQSAARGDAQGSVEARHAYAALVEEHDKALLRLAEVECQLEAARKRLTEYEKVLPFECLMAGMVRT